MEEIFFLIGSILCLSATSAAYGINYWDEPERPMSAKPYVWLMNVAGPAALILIIGGFFVYSWWLPLIALSLGAYGHKFLDDVGRKLTAGPGLIFITGVVGIILSVFIMLRMASRIGWM